MVGFVKKIVEVCFVRVLYSPQSRCSRTQNPSGKITMAIPAHEPKIMKAFCKCVLFPLVMFHGQRTTLI